MNFLSEGLYYIKTYDVACLIFLLFIVILPLKHICIDIIYGRCRIKKMSADCLFSIIFYIGLVVALACMVQKIIYEESIIEKTVAFTIVLLEIYKILDCSEIFIKIQKHLCLLEKMMWMILICVFAFTDFYIIAVILLTLLLIRCYFIVANGYLEPELCLWVWVKVSCDTKNKDICRAIKEHNPDVKYIKVFKKGLITIMLNSNMRLLRLGFCDENTDIEKVIKNLSEIEGIISVAKADEEI